MQQCCVYRVRSTGGGWGWYLISMGVVLLGRSWRLAGGIDKGEGVEGHEIAPKGVVSWQCQLSFKVGRPKHNRRSWQCQLSFKVGGVMCGTGI